MAFFSVRFLNVLCGSNESPLSDISPCAMLYALCHYSQGRVGGEIQSRQFAALSNRFHGNASSSEKRPVI